MLARRALKFNWVPVGGGVKPVHEVKRLFHILFPEESGAETTDEIDAKMGTLPGLHGIELMREYFRAEIN